MLTRPPLLHLKLAQAQAINPQNHVIFLNTDLLGTSLEKKMGKKDAGGAGKKRTNPSEVKIVATVVAGLKACG